jgi:hypothetical protein
VEGDYLHYIDSVGDERQMDQISNGAAPGGVVAGSLWIETGDDKIGYINEDADEKFVAGCGCGSGIPTFTVGPNNSANADTCFGGGSLFTISWTLSSEPAWAAIEVWRCTTSGCSDFVFWKRLAIATGSTTDPVIGYGTDGAGSSVTFYRTYKVRVVPACSANGAGPFCRDGTTSEASMTLESCVE